jgi:hypothetical protein
MKKSKLLEFLNSLEGDPDILIWNGQVGDWMDLGKPERTFMVRESVSYVLRLALLDAMRKAQSFTVKLSEETQEEIRKTFHKYHEWRLPTFCSDEQIKNGDFTKKKVVLFPLKSRNVETWDRLGTIKY